MTSPHTRREAREAVFGLLFEQEFHFDESPETVFNTSVENREIAVDPYIRGVYFGVLQHRKEIDELLEKHAKGWTVARMSRVSRTILRLAVYEMMFLRDEIPNRVSINEAIELSKKFDEEKARRFINGILNAVKNDLASLPKETATPDENNSDGEPAAKADNPLS